MEKETRPHVKPGSVKYTRGYGWKLLANRIKQLLLTTIVLSIVAGAIFTFIKQPVRTSEGFITAQITGKKHIIGDKVIVVKGENYNMFTPLLRVVFEQEVYEATVIAGPYGEIKSDGESHKVVYAGQSVNVNLEVEVPEYIDDEYVVRNNLDIEVPDEVVSKKFILGFVK